ncbi:uncharacterized protein LOC130974059 isoform X3 [Arachis stenosperma]|uniref:uncharacterized protein LOC130974059 isoform X3 n=1 Tax=Arachis stenosperma TaxID=217475 RepID=UPI0025AD20D3|nr:uncharacterized protein LOC130974059 isoform X3 [Arachis stenosperma]
MAQNKTGNKLGANTAKDLGVLPQHIQPELGCGSDTGQIVYNNIVLATGRGFSENISHDGVSAGRVPHSPDISRSSEHRFMLNRENGHVRYEELSNILGLRRMDSENAAEMDEIPSLNKQDQEMKNGVPGVSLRKTVPGDRDTRNRVQSSTGTLDDSLPWKMKLLCSSGGKILPRPSDGKLRYVGGETRIISTRKDLSWEELVKKTSSICRQPHTIKYQLPGEDLDALISVSSEEDLQNMTEEYHGFERREGSQRLRIFLVPLTESEETPLTEVSMIQQSDPDYQYVVAVNGIADPSPRNNNGGMSLTNEASQFAPVFQKISPNPSSAFENKGAANSLNGDGVLNKSVSPIRIQVSGSSAGYVPFLGNERFQGSTESNVSFVTALLPPENSGTVIADWQYPQHAAAGQSKILNGQHFGNYNLGKGFVTHGCEDKLFGERLFQREKGNYLGNPLSCLEDPICQQAESDGISGSPYGLPHAFSDSQLHESAVRSGYCLQERIGQSFSLNLENTQLSSILLSNISQGNPLELQRDPILHHTQLQSKIPKGDSAELSKRQEMTSSSPYSDSLGMNFDVYNGSISTENRYPKAQSRLTDYSFVANDIQDNSVKLEKMKIIEEFNCFPSNNGNVYVEKPAIIDMGNMSELHLLDSFLPSNSNSQVNVQKNWEVTSEDRIPASLGMAELSPNNIVDKIPSDLLDMSQRTDDSKKCALAEGLNGKQDIDFSLTRILDLNAPLKDEESSSGKSNLGNNFFELSINPDSLKCAPIQLSENQLASGFHENSTLSAARLHPASPPVGYGPKFNLPMNVNTAGENSSFRKAPSFFDDSVSSTDQIIDLSDPSKNIQWCHEASRVQPFVVVDNVISVSPPNVESSLVLSPNSVDDRGSDVGSLAHTEAESILPESELEDFKDNQTDKHDFLSDAMIAEMEASIYGLQIIRNADLEDLSELGSGTYGTVYHGKWRGTDVAIKRIKKSCFAGRSSEQERLAKDFWREAQILSNLHHPNVVAFYGIVPDGVGGTLATVTEFMVNGSLRHVLIKKERLLDRHRKLIIAMDAAFGMEYLHSKNIVHFDLKCDNLLVNLRDPQRPVCKVGDFGLSRIKRNTLVSGGVRGTLPWMAPELLNGSSSRVSEKVDVFSFGISLWELFTGEEPYADMHCGAIIGGIVKNTLRPPIPERCDPEWRKLMEECWSADPNSRPSFTEITSRLRSMSIGLQVKGTG